MAIEIGDGIIRFKGDYSQVQSSLQKAAPAMRQVGMIATAAGAGMAAVIGSAVKQAASFEQAITNAASVTGKTGEEFKIARDKMEGLAKTLGRTTVFSAKECANAFYDLASKGFDVASMSVEELTPILDLAAATQADLTFSTETVTATLRAFGMENKETARIADVFTKACGMTAAKIDILREGMKYVAPVAKAAGASFEETTGAISALANVGYEGSMAGTALRSTFSELMSPSDKFCKILERLKLNTEDVNLTNHTFAEILEKLKGAGFTAADAMDVFGQRAGPAMVSLLEQGSGALEGLTTQLKNAGGTAHEIATLQLDTLEGQGKILKSTVEALALELGKALIPALKSLAEWAARNIGRAAEWAEKHPGLTKAIVGTAAAIAALLLVVGPLLTMASHAIIVFGGLSTALGAAGVAGAVGTAGGAFAGFAALLGPAGIVIAALTGLFFILRAVHRSLLETGEALEEQQRSEEAVAAKRQELHAQEQRLRDDELHQRTGFSERAIGLIQEQLEKETGVAVDREALVQRIIELNQNQEMSVTQMIQTMKNEISTGEATWFGSHTRMAEATRQWKDQVSAHYAEVGQQINMLEAEMMAMGGRSWWIDIFNRMSGSVNAWQTHFGQSIGSALVNMRKLRSGSETILGNIPMMGLGGTAGWGFGMMESGSMVTDAMIARLRAMAAGKATAPAAPAMTADMVAKLSGASAGAPSISVSIAEYATFNVRKNEDIEDISKSLAEQVRDVLRQQGQRLAISRA